MDEELALNLPERGSPEYNELLVFLITFSCIIGSTIYYTMDDQVVYVNRDALCGYEETDISFPECQGLQTRNQVFGLEEDVWQKVNLSLNVK